MEKYLVSFKMSNKMMSDVMYAILMTEAEITDSIVPDKTKQRADCRSDEATLYIRIHHVHVDDFVRLTGLEMKSV